MFNQIVSNGGNYTVLSLVEKYVSLKIGVRHSTKAGYKTVINILKKDPFGDKRIDKVKLSDAKAWLIKLQTEKGIRYVPMTEEVAECFRRIIKNRTAPKAEPIIAGYTGFLFLDKNDMPMVALHWEKYMQHILEKYNSIYKVQMPKITPHVCRHTFCSNMAKSGMNPKTLQYIMGHSDISVTLNTYTHVNFEDAQSELQRVVGE